MRAAILTSAALLALAPCGLHAASTKRADARLEAIVVHASGSGSEARFDPRIPPAFRRQLQDCRLAYTRYNLVGIRQSLATFGVEVRFPLPDNEALGILATATDSRTHPVCIHARILDSRSKVIQKIQVRTPYARTFLIHRPKKSAAVIMGVSAHKPRDR